MAEILSLHAQEILDSRGNPTVGVTLTTSNGCTGHAGVPSGASTGTREALEKRDGDTSRYLGKGVQGAVAAVNEVIAPAVCGMDVRDQAALDAALLKLDGTENKEKLGANALLGVSMAAAVAAAGHRGVPLYAHLADLFAPHNAASGGRGGQPEDAGRRLPMPMMNVINGGSHADNKLDIQEFMIVPVGAASFREALRMGAEVFHALKSLLKAGGHVTAVGDEGGFAPSFNSNREAMDWLMKAVEKAGYTPGKDVAFALDAAASEFQESVGNYDLAGEGRTLDAAGLIDLYAELVAAYPIVSIEDGMAEDDRAGWKAQTAQMGDKIQLVGDDLFVTNPAIFKQGIADGLANSILIKLNQIGTVTETLATMAMARAQGYAAVVSHRSGETEDTFIADLATATACGQIKTGSLSRSDRVAKYNRLLAIEAELGSAAAFRNWVGE